ncbi:unnamed protein product [Mytilus coruscus]|uniref:Protein-tyrosine-phosphatase n=1 Tax=Mytilus coruscus TaxID=42192 RepID=A0A6J8BNM5_MYTCO|nr:unnamed protein product [Mytilus coruscus]
MPVESYRLVMKKEIQHTVYVYRLIILQNNSLKNKQERKVHHFHFTQWPDHGVPDSVKLVYFYRKVKSIKVDKSSPMVVYCSAGVGRTGTFIAIDALYEHGQKEGYVDIMEYVQTMRKDRMNMVQTHKSKERISLNVFTAEDWTISIAPPSPEYMLDLFRRVQNCREMQKCPITVVCSDGCSKSGLFVAMKWVLEKMQIDEEIDIFQVVREIQTRRPEFLVELDQYEYCYKCIRVLLEGDSRDSLYANV